MTATRAEGAAPAVRHVVVGLGGVFAWFWLALLAHEGAHYFVAGIVGLRRASGPIHRSAFEQFAVVSAGPIVTLLLLFGAYLIARRNRIRLDGAPSVPRRVLRADRPRLLVIMIVAVVLGWISAFTLGRAVGLPI